MKTSACLTLCFVFLLGAVSMAQAQGGEGYTFITTEFGPQICLGRWVPSKDVALPGVCQGQLVGLPQLTAISSKQTVDRLGQLLVTLDSIDRRLAVNNDQMDRLIEATVNTQSSIDEQVRQVNDFLREAIARRFNELPAELLKNDEFREELSKLKQDILNEVDKYYSRRTPPATK
jgi:hypothetical protein